MLQAHCLMLGKSTFAIIRAFESFYSNINLLFNQFCHYTIETDIHPNRLCNFKEIHYLDLKRLLAQ